MADDEKVPSEPPQAAGAEEAAVEETAVIVDLDETLWLRNSTEEFLGSIRPRWLVGALLMTIRISRIWRIFGRHEIAEDWFRVTVCACVFPWSIVAWRRRVRRYGPMHANHELLALIAGRTSAAVPLVVATRGFATVVEPLVQSLDLPAHQLVACRLWKGRHDREQGKAQMLVEHLGEQVVRGSTVITDSETDRELLDLSARPLLLRWPDARYRQAPTVYVPFAYTEIYKRAGQNYVRFALSRDLVLWVLATIFVSSVSVPAHLGGLVALFVSFWCVYEMGYLENDRVAERYEAEPVLPDGDRQPLGLTYRVSAWMWALALGALGVSLVHPGALIVGTLAWVALLGFMRVTFFVYNHVDKATRPVVYVGLHALRMMAPLVLVPAATAGLIALLLTIWSRSTAYAVYRSVGTWIRVATMVADAVHLGIAYLLLWWAGVAIEGGVAAVMVFWFLFIARGEARALLANMHSVRSTRSVS